MRVTAYGIYFNGEVVSERILVLEQINMAELRVLQEVMRRFGDQMADSTVTWRCDNLMAIRVFRKQGLTKSWNLCNLAIDLLKEAEERRIKFNPVYICSEENWLVDAALRLKCAEDWSRKEQAFERVIACFGRPDVDLMASQKTRKCLMFIRYNKQDKEAMQVNALAQDVS